MRDGSDAIADWPLLNALVNTASGASWVSIHHGGEWASKDLSTPVRSALPTVRPWLGRNCYVSSPTTLDGRHPTSMRATRGGRGRSGALAHIPMSEHDDREPLLDNIGELVATIPACLIRWAYARTSP